MTTAMARKNAATALAASRVRVAVTVWGPIASVSVRSVAVPATGADPPAYALDAPGQVAVLVDERAALRAPRPSR